VEALEHGLDDLLGAHPLDVGVADQLVHRVLHGSNGITHDEFLFVELE
jgi:hypothetical protein